METDKEVDEERSYGGRGWRGWRRRLASFCSAVLGRNLRQRLNTLRRLLWVAAVGICCYFMVAQVNMNSHLIFHIFFFSKNEHNYSYIHYH
jgi:hypothetical protein